MIAELLKHGEEQAMKTNELLRLTGTATARKLQNVIARERAAGVLILSTTRNGGGYYLPDEGEKGQQEVAAYVSTLRARALNTLQVLKPAVLASKAYTRRQQASLLDGITEGVSDV